MPKNTGMVVINNRSIENFKKFNSWKMLGTSIITGTMTANIKGIVIKDKQAVIAVKETDKATFPPANLVK